MLTLIRHLLSGRYFLTSGTSKHRMTIWDINNSNVVTYTRRVTAWSH